VIEAHCAQCAVTDESLHIRIPGVATGPLDLELRDDKDARTARRMARVARALQRWEAVRAGGAWGPKGQAALWLRDVKAYVPKGRLSAAHAVAVEIARLCGDDSQILKLTWRSLAEAVGRSDGLGRPVAFVQAGVKVLEEHGWLERETTGKGRGAVTVWRLMVGPAVLESADDLSAGA
jgi:hypothetical protein